MSTLRRGILLFVNEAGILIGPIRVDLAEYRTNIRQVHSSFGRNCRILPSIRQSDSFAERVCRIHNVYSAILILNPYRPRIGSRRLHRPIDMFPEMLYSLSLSSLSLCLNTYVSFQY